MGELDERMSLDEFLEWQSFDTWRADKAAQQQRLDNLGKPA